MVHGNLTNIHRNSDIFKPIATDEITIWTYYSKEFLGLDKKLIPTQLTSQSDEFCDLKAMMRGEVLKGLRYQGLRRRMGIMNLVTKYCSSSSSIPLPLPPRTSCGFLAHHLLLLWCGIGFDGNWVKMHALASPFEHFSLELPPSGDGPLLVTASDTPPGE